MKKALALLLTLVLSLTLLTACGGSKTPPAASGSGSASAGGTTTDKLPGEGMKIALVCDKVGTQVFLTQMVKAMEEAAAKYGFQSTIVECADSAQFEDNMRAVVAEDFDLIIGAGWQAGDAINKVATEYPDAAQYALIDSEVEAANVKCISYREQEGAYLIGVLAALTVDGESSTYGSVHVNEGPGSWKWRWGFQEGVKSIDPSATFIFNYIGNYSDPAKAKELTIQQYEQGARFIQSCAAGGDSGAFEAAKEKGFYTSGQDIDLTDPNNSYIVSSQIKDTYQSVWNVVNEFFSDSWSTENSVWGLSEDTIGAVYVTHESANPRSERISDEDVAALKQVAEDIRSGKLALEMPTEEAYAK